MSRKIASLTIQNKKLSKKLQLEKQNKPAFTWKDIKSDEKMNFYTGIVSVKAFHAIYRLLLPYLIHLQYWRGARHQVKKVNKKSKISAGKEELTNLHKKMSFY